jgi:hypothetical protein
VNHPKQGEWVKNIRKQGGRSEPFAAKGVGEKHQKSREGEVNHPQQGEWVKHNIKAGRGK